MSTESVFISYSNKDAEFATNLANSLTKAGANVWIESINGQNNEDVTAVAIKSAKLFLIVTSNNALNDESLKQEKDFARENKVDRLLAKIEPCETENKMRWQSLPCIDFSKNQQEGLNTILNKLNVSTEENAKETVNIQIPNTENTPQAEVQKIKETLEKHPPSTNQDLSRKLSLLISDDDINNTKSIVLNKLRDAKNQTYIYIAGAVGLIIVVFFSEAGKEMFTTGKEGVDNVVGFLEKFYPGISAALPTVISGNSFKKLKEHKKNVGLIDQLKSKRDRMKDAIETYSEPEIKKLEEDLESLIKF
jgi:TIR domain-containing protein